MQCPEHQITLHVYILSVKIVQNRTKTIVWMENVIGFRGENSVLKYVSSAIHLRPMPRFVFKFIRISVDGENIENDTNSIVWIENFTSFYEIARSKALRANPEVNFIRFMKSEKKVTWFVNVRKFSPWLEIQTPPSRPWKIGYIYMHMKLQCPAPFLSIPEFRCNRKNSFISPGKLQNRFAVSYV